MKTIGEAHPEEFEEIFRHLKADDAVIEKSELFREFGKSGPGESSAEAQSSWQFQSSWPRWPMAAF